MTANEIRLSSAEVMCSIHPLIGLRGLRIAWGILFWAFVSSVNAGEDSRVASPVRAWDDIVSSMLFSDFANFEFKVRQEPGERVYTFTSTDEAGELALSIAVAIAPVGSRLPVAELQEAIAAADISTRTRDFPDIGARARAAATLFSPEGVISDVTFATSDAFFDVFVSVFEASSSEERPPLTAEDAARRLDSAYDGSRL